MNKKLKVISAFAGIGCGELALKQAGFSSKVYAYEIDKYALAVNRYHNPETIFLGDIRNWREHIDLIDSVDLIMGGSPCQDLSVSGKRAGLTGSRSGLFYEFAKMIKYYKPRYFFLENVASMATLEKNKITEEVGVEPVLLDSAIVSAQSRKRFYWTNIPVKNPKNRNLCVNDILEANPKELVPTYKLKIKYEQHKTKNDLICVGSIYPSEHSIGRVYSPAGKSPTIRASAGGCKTGAFLIDYTRQSCSQSSRVFSVEGKSPTVMASKESCRGGMFSINNTIRGLTSVELERLQTLPDNYTKYGIDEAGNKIELSKTRRQILVGNGWTVDLIREAFFKNIRISSRMEFSMQKPVNKKQLLLIHIAKNQLGIDEETYRETLEYRYNVSSAKELSYNQASALIGMFIQNGFKIPKKKKSSPAIKKNDKVIRLATSYQHKLIEVLKNNILWKYENGYELYIKKRFKIDKVITMNDAFKVINGLKGMIGIKTDIIDMQALPFPFNPEKFKYSEDGTAWVFDIVNKKLIKINRGLYERI